jgi:hypothetical protein
MSQLVTMEYQGQVVSFTEDGWFNATEVADRFGKRPVDWTRLEETKAYLLAIAEALGISEPKSLIRAKKNSGTWFHPKLAVRFAQWLDMRFAVWCDLQIDSLIKGTHPHHDWKMMRHEAASSYKVMGAVMQLVRQNQGKMVARHHFTNEARLVNWALTGEFKGIDRDALSGLELDLLAKLEERNAVLIGCGLEYQDRKIALERFASEWRTERTPRLAAVA